MKILYITLENISLQKGSAIHIREISEGLRKRGHIVGLIASSSGDFQSSKNFINLKKIPNSILNLLKLEKQPYFISSFFLFISLIRILPDYDIIYARDYHTVNIAFLPKILFNKKLIYEINGIASEEQRLKRPSIVGEIISWFIKFAEKLATSTSNCIISVTPQIKEYLIQNHNCNPKKIKIVSNGVDTSKFSQIKDEFLIKNIRKKYGLKGEDTVVVFVGNLSPWQGVDILFKASKLLPTNKIKFLIVGEGKIKERLLDKAKELNVLDNFIFTGEVPHTEIPLLINSGDICVLPKINLKSGYSPIKLYEYMACGKPIISSKVDGLEFIEKEEIGKVINPGDIINWANCLWELSIDQQTRKNMGEKALKLAQERFDWRLKVIEVERVIQETLQQNEEK